MKQDIMSYVRGVTMLPMPCTAIKNIHKQGVRKRRRCCRTVKNPCYHADLSPHLAIPKNLARPWTKSVELRGHLSKRTATYMFKAFSCSLNQFVHVKKSNTNLQAGGWQDGLQLRV
jgi:hypothetical protein